MAFDPYRSWLGIKTTERPPTLYALVGVDEFEPDAEKIHQASLIQLSKVRKHQAGRHSDLSQQIMNEISQARVRLLDPTQRAEYDLWLHVERTRRGPAEIARPFVAGRRSLVAMLLGAAVVFAAVIAVIAVTGNRTGLIPSDENEIVASAEPARGVADQEERPPPDPAFPLLPTRPGLQTLWEERVADEQAGHVFCRGDFDEAPLAVDLKTHRILVGADAGECRGLYLPCPSGDFRWLLHLAEVGLSNPKQRISFVAICSPDETNGIEITIDAGRMVARQRSGGLSDPPSGAKPLPAAQFFLELVRHLGKLSFAVSADGKTFEAAAPPLPLSFEPVALALLIDNGAGTPAQTAIDYIRIEGKDAAYAAKRKAWPAIPRLPTSDGLAELFGGAFAIDARGHARLHYDFLFERAVSHWGEGRNATANGVIVPAGKTVDHGPLARVRSLRFSFRFASEPLPKFELRFASGGAIRFDPAEAVVVVDPAPQKGGDRSDSQGAPSSETMSVHFPFRQGEDYAARMDIGGGAASIRLNNKKIYDGTGTGFSGTMQSKVVGPGDMEVLSFVAEGRFDGVPIWLGQLAGADNVLTRHDAKPSDVTVKPEHRGPASPIEITRRSEEPDLPFQLEPGQPAPLAWINTSADETDPFLESDGLTLHFARKVGDRFELRLGRRATTRLQFAQEGRLKGIEPKGNARSPSMTSDRRLLVFANDAGGNFDIVAAARNRVSEPFGAATPIKATASEQGLDERAPFIAPAGRDLFFIRPEQRGTQVFHATRLGDALVFQTPTPLLVGTTLRHASVTGDGRTMYLERTDAESKRTSIFRSRRKTDGSWTRPEPLPELKDASTPRGDAAPFISPDGRLLFFASDRAGGAGGLDLWVVAQEADANSVAKAETKAEDARPERDAEPAKSDGSPKVVAAPPKNHQPSATKSPASAPKPIEGPLHDVLLLGPIPKSAVSNPNSDREVVTQLCLRIVRRVPSAGEKEHGLVWARSAQVKFEPGIYLFAMPLLIQEKSDIRIDVNGTPGGFILWLNGTELLRSWREDPWAANGKLEMRSEAKTLYPRKARITGVLCVADRETPFSIRCLDAESLETSQTVVTDPD